MSERKREKNEKENEKKIIDNFPLFKIKIMRIFSHLKYFFHVFPFSHTHIRDLMTIERNPLNRCQISLSFLLAVFFMSSE